MTELSSTQTTLKTFYQDHKNFQSIFKNLLIKNTFSLEWYNIWKHKYKLLLLKMSSNQKKYFFFIIFLWSFYGNKWKIYFQDNILLSFTVTSIEQVKSLHLNDEINKWIDKVIFFWLKEPTIYLIFRMTNVNVWDHHENLWILECIESTMIIIKKSFLSLWRSYFIRRNHDSWTKLICCSDLIDKLSIIFIK